jgi:hypothetical protein
MSVLDTIRQQVYAQDGATSIFISLTEEEYVDFKRLSLKELEKVEIGDAEFHFRIIPKDDQDGS